MKNFRSLQEASHICSEMIMQQIPQLKTVSLTKDTIDMIIKESICTNILTHHEVEYQINKKLYHQLENAIKNFAQFKKTIQEKSLNDEAIFRQWSEKKENYSFKKYEPIILQRTAADPIKRLPASSD